MRWKLASGIVASVFFLAACQTTKPGDARHAWLNGTYAGTASSGWKQCWTFKVVNGNEVTGDQERSRGDRAYNDSLSGKVQKGVATVTVHSSQGMDYTIERLGRDKGLVSVHESGASNVLLPVKKCPG